MKMTGRIEGGLQLSRALRSLPEAVSNRVVKSALLAAAEPIQNTGSAIAPRAPGAPDLAEHIVISVARREEPGDVAVVIGPANERRADTGTNYSVQGLMVELGTARMRAQPFMRPAFEANAEQSFRTLQRLLWDAIARHAGTRGQRGSGVGV